MKEGTRLVTAEDLLHMPSREGRRELVRGEVREMAPTGGAHGRVTNRLQSRLDRFVDYEDIGDVFAAETGFLIERDPDTVLAADCAFVRAGRLPDPTPEGFLALAPDLAVETLSPGDRPAPVRRKVEQWLSAGTRAVWVLDPRRRTITVHLPGAPPRVLSDGDVLEGGEVVPGFRVEVTEVFA